MPVGSWIYEISTPTGGGVAPPFVPPDAPPVSFDRIDQREVYDGKFEVSCYWTAAPSATPDNFRGVAVFVEDPDISSGARSPLNGSQRLNTTAQLSGTWNPIKQNDDFESPATFLIDGQAAARKIRVYLQAFGKVTNATLVQANKPNPTPSRTVTIPASSAAYVSGQEYAWIVSGVSATRIDDWDNPGGPRYHFVFDYTEPDPATPLPPGLDAFGGVRIVYEYPDGSRAIGPFLETKKPETWFSPDYEPGQGGSYKIYFVSTDVQGRINTIVPGWTPMVPVTIVYPPAGQPSAPYVTGLALSNPRHEWQPDGTLYAKADLTWTLPDSPRYGGVYFYRTGVTPPRLLGQATGNVGSLTLQVIDWPKLPEDWTIVAISIDYNLQPSDDPASPAAGTPRVVWHIGPPGPGGTGQEYTPLAGIGGAAITTEQQLNSDGVVMMRHKITGWTNPTDNSFGGMTIARVYGGDTAGATFWDVPKNQTSFTTDWEPAPAARTWDFYFVSRDMQDRRNTIQPGITPSVSVPFTPMAGDIKASRMPSGWWDTSEFDWPNQDAGGLFTAKLIQAQKIFVGSILRVGGGTGTAAANFAGNQNGQIGVFSSDNIIRAWMGQQNSVATANQPSHTVYGGWFQELYIGGDGPPTAPIYATQAGVVIVGGFDIQGSRYPYISIQRNDGVEVGRIGARIGQGLVTPSDPAYIAGAWMKEFACGGQSLADWRILCRRDPTNAAGGDLVNLRNINKFTIDYIQNYADANHPTNAACHYELGYDAFVADASGTNYWKFPGMRLYRSAAPTHGITITNRGFIFGGPNGRLGFLGSYNNVQTGDDSGTFSAQLVLYSSSSNNINIILGSDTGSARPGAAFFRMQDEVGNITFMADQAGNVTARGNLTVTTGPLYVGGYQVIGTNGQYNSPQGIQTTGGIRADAGFLVGSNAGQDLTYTDGWGAKIHFNKGIMYQFDTATVPTITEQINVALYPSGWIELYFTNGLLSGRIRH